MCLQFSPKQWIKPTAHRKTRLCTCHESLPCLNSFSLELIRCSFIQQRVQIRGRAKAELVGVLFRITVVRVLEQRIGKRIAAANDGRIKLDTLRHSISKGTMHKYILVSLGGIGAVALFASCQQQGSTTTTPAASSTEMRHVRSGNQTVSASTNRNIAPGGTRRAPTPSPSPTP